MRSFRRSLWVLLTSVLLTLTLAPAAHARLDLFPDVIPLPNGWQPEGIAAGPGTTVYAGSRLTGAIWRGDIRTGAGEPFVVPVPSEGRLALGLKYSRRLLYVSGGTTGNAYFYDARTGKDVIEPCDLTDGPAFVNDVVVTRNAAYFTNSQAPQLFRVPIQGGRPVCDVTPLALSGEWEQGTGFGANGIDATRDGKTLVVVNSGTGKIYTVDPATGDATQIQTSAVLTNGDGILLRGRLLFVVQNRDNRVAVLWLSRDLSSAHLLTNLTDPGFVVPTTIAAFGPALYAVNAKFGRTGPDVPYEIVRVDGR
jgi:sugar lactone lactonase YvrE